MRKLKTRWILAGVIALGTIGGLTWSPRPVKDVPPPERVLQPATSNTPHENLAVAHLREIGALKSTLYYHDKVRHLLEQARQLLSKGLPPASTALGDKPLDSKPRVDANGQLVIDAELMRHFRFYFSLLTNEEPVELAMARLLGQMNDLDPGVREQVMAALVSYLNTEYSRQDFYLIRQGELQQRSSEWMNSVHPDDPSSYRSAAFSQYGFQMETLEQERQVTSTYGGKLAEALFQDEMAQHHQLMERARVATAPGLNTETRIEQSMPLYGLTPRMDASDPNVFAQYLELDSALIKNAPGTDARSVRALRERYFGAAMADRLEQIYTPETAAQKGESRSY